MILRLICAGSWVIYRRTLLLYRQAGNNCLPVTSNPSLWESNWFCEASYVFWFHKQFFFLSDFTVDLCFSDWVKPGLSSFSSWSSPIRCTVLAPPQRVVLDTQVPVTSSLPCCSMPCIFCSCMRPFVVWSFPLCLLVYFSSLCSTCWVLSGRALLFRLKEQGSTFWPICTVETQQTYFLFRKVRKGCPAFPLCHSQSCDWSQQRPERRAFRPSLISTLWENHKSKNACDPS